MPAPVAGRASPDAPKPGVNCSQRTLDLVQLLGIAMDTSAARQPDGGTTVQVPPARASFGFGGVLASVSSDTVIMPVGVWPRSQKLTPVNEDASTQPSRTPTPPPQSAVAVLLERTAHLLELAPAESSSE